MSFLLNSTFGLFSAGSGGGGASGPPFALDSAKNGLSVDIIDREIVLGGSVGSSVLATLLDDREIPMNGNSILFSLPAAAQNILLFNMPGSSSYFQFLMERTDNDPGDGINNPFKWGWNVNRNLEPTLSGIWYSLEPNYRPGGARFKEAHLEIALPNGEGTRLFSSTFQERSTLALSDNLWFFSGSSFEFRSLDNLVTTLALSEGTMTLNTNNTGGITQFKIQNAGQQATFFVSPGGGTLVLSDLPLRVVGNLALQTQTNDANGRAGIRFFNHVGGDADIIFHGPSWPDPITAGGLQIANATQADPVSILFNSTNKIILGTLDAFAIGATPIQVFDTMNYAACQEFASNALALAGGLVVGDLYRTGGVTMIVI